MSTQTKGRQERGRPRQFDENDALSVALRVFRKHGFEAAGTDLLSNEMGMKKTSIYRTFGKKSDLFGQCCELYLQNIVDKLEQELAKGETCQQMIEFCLNDAAEYFFASQQEEMACIVAIIAPATATNPSFVSKANVVLESSIERALLTRFPDDVHSPKDIASLFVACIHSLAVRARSGASLDELKSTCKVFSKAITSSL